MFRLRVKDPAGLESRLAPGPGRYAAGGAPGDLLRVEGAPASALGLELGVADLVVTPREEGAVLSGRPLSAGERRLVRRGDRLEYRGWALEVEHDDLALGDGTGALARAALAGALGGGAPAAVPTLVWLCGKDCGLRLPILDEATYLGRGDGAGARVRDPLASRKHAKLVIKGDKARLVDLESANGVAVDGTRVDGERRLYGGEVIRIGHTELAFEAKLDRPEAPPEKLAEPKAPPRHDRQVEAARSRVRPLMAMELLLLGAGSAIAAIGLAVAWLILR